MPRLGDLVEKIRSKNAGPFMLTIDIFCGDAGAFQTVSDGLKTAMISRVFGVDPQRVRRFDIPDLNVVKFSFPRPVVQGARTDRDMHGAAYAALLADQQFPSAPDV